MDKDKLEREICLLHNQVCYALSDPKRVLILYLLAEGGRLVNEIAEQLGMPQSTVSRHLRVLRERNLVRTERQGVTIRYSLADERIIRALDLMRSILVDQLTANAQVLNQGD